MNQKGGKNSKIFQSFILKVYLRHLKDWINLIIKDDGRCIAKTNQSIVLLKGVHCMLDTVVELKLCSIVEKNFRILLIPIRHFYGVQLLNK